MKFNGGSKEKKRHPTQVDFFGGVGGMFAVELGKKQNGKRLAKAWSNAIF